LTLVRIPSTHFWAIAQLSRPAAVRLAPREDQLPGTPFEALAAAGALWCLDLFGFLSQAPEVVFSGKLQGIPDANAHSEWRAFVMYSNDSVVVD